MTESEWYGTAAEDYRDGWWPRYQIAFPGVVQWLRDHSGDPAQTVATWFTATAKIPRAIADEVLAKWINGDLEPPTGYKRELTGILLRSYGGRILMDRDKVWRQGVERGQYDAARRGRDEWSTMDYRAVLEHFWRLCRDRDWSDHNEAQHGRLGKRMSDWVQWQVAEAGLSVRDGDTEAGYRERVLAAGIPLVAGKIGGLKRVNDI